MRSPSAFLPGAFRVLLGALALVFIALVALPSAAHGQSLMQRLRAARPELVIYGRPQHSNANAELDRLLRSTGFGDSVLWGTSNCGLLCGGMGGPSGLAWYPYPDHVNRTGGSTKVITLSAALRPHVRATALFASEATLGASIGASCPNAACGNYYSSTGERYLIGLDPSVSSIALLAEGEFGALRLGVGPAIHGVTVQSLSWIDERRQWKERYRPVGAMASAGLTFALWRELVVSGRWVYSAIGDVQLSARDVSNNMAPGSRRFEGGRVNLSNSYVLLGVGLRMR